MKKVSISQSTQTGKIYNKTGNGQRITVTKSGKSASEDDWEGEFEGEESWALDEGDDDDIIAPIGKHAKVFINGKRVR